MNKRIFAFFLSIFMIVSVLAFPALASETDSSFWTNLLDYGYPEGYATNYIDLTTIPSGSTILRYTVPGAPFIYDYDVVFRTDATDFKIGTIKDWMQVVSLGDGLYRAFGKSDYRSGRTPLYFDFTGGTYLEILRFNVSSYDVASYTKSISGTITLHGGISGQRSIFYPDTNPTLVHIDNTGKAPTTFQSRLLISEWNTMDFVQVELGMWVSSVDSVNVSHAGIKLPFEMSIVNSGDKSDHSFYLVSLLIDLRDLPRDASGDIVLFISGIIGANMSASVSIGACHGFLEISDPSPLTYWFTNLRSWIIGYAESIVAQLQTLGRNISTWLSNQTWSITNAISTWGQAIVDALGANSDSSEFEQGVSDANDKLSDASDAMNDFTRPAADSVVPDLGEFDSSSVDILSQFFNNQLVSPLVTASLAVWLIGIIFGV